MRWMMALPAVDGVVSAQLRCPDHAGHGGVFTSGLARPRVLSLLQDPCSRFAARHTARPRGHQGHGRTPSIPDKPSVQDRPPECLLPPPVVSPRGSSPRPNTGAHGQEGVRAAGLSQAGLRALGPPSSPGAFPLPVRHQTRTPELSPCPSVAWFKQTQELSRKVTKGEG